MAMIKQPRRTSWHVCITLADAMVYCLFFWQLC